MTVVAGWHDEDVDLPERQAREALAAYAAARDTADGPALRRKTVAEIYLVGDLDIRTSLLEELGPEKKPVAEPKKAAPAREEKRVRIEEAQVEERVEPDVDEAPARPKRRRARPEVRAVKKVLQCGTCGKTFKAPAGLARHAVGSCGKPKRPRVRSKTAAKRAGPSGARPSTGEGPSSGTDLRKPRAIAIAIGEEPRTVAPPAAAPVLPEVAIAAARAALSALPVATRRAAAELLFESL